MGGPRAWKKLQKAQEEFQNNWGQEELVDTNSDDDEEDRSAREAAKKDLYAHYDLDPETENEKSQRSREFGDTGERPGEEDVSGLSHSTTKYSYLLGVYNSYDAPDAEC